MPKPRGVLLREADARRDAAVRAIALKRHAHLIRWMTKQLHGPGLRTRRIAGSKSIGWSWREIFGSDSGPSWLLFDHPNDKWAGSIQWGRTGPEMHLHILTDEGVGAALKKLATPHWRDIFVHEFIHWHDKTTRGVGGDWNTVGLRTSKGDSAYYLDPHEYNAYFQQGAAYVERNVRGLNRSALQHFVRGLLTRPPQEFVAVHTNPSSTSWDRQFVEYVRADPKRLRAFQKRLVTLYHHLNQRYVREAR